jgi:hypothetical protein
VRPPVLVEERRAVGVMPTSVASDALTVIAFGDGR